MLTQDENIVDVRFTVQYTVKDAREFLYENRDPEQAVMLPPNRRSARSWAAARWTPCSTSSATRSRSSWPSPSRSSWTD